MWSWIVQKNVGKVLHALIVILIFSAGLFMFGNGSLSAWTSPSLIYLTSKESEISISVQQRAWIASVTNLGAIFGFPMTCFLMDRIGRKKTMIVYAIPYNISWIMIIFGKNFEVLCAARFIAGFGNAAVATVTVYLSEITEKNIRGTVTILSLVSYDLGVFSVNLMGAYLSYNHMNIVLIIPSIIYFVCLQFLPESPYFLSMNNQKEQAVINLLKFRGKKKVQSINEEMQEVEKSTSELQEYSNFNLKELFKVESNRRAFVIVLVANVTLMLSGNFPIIVYTQQIFEYSGFSLEPAYSAASVGAMKLVSGLVLARLVDKGGRKLFFFSSGIICGISTITIGLFFFLKFQTNVNVSGVNWIPLVGLLAFEIGSPLGISKIPYLLMGEVFPMNVKKTAVSGIELFNDTLTFTMKFVFPILNDAAGIYTSFWLFAICCLTGTFVFFSIAPETKGKSLSEIEAILKSK